MLITELIGILEQILNSDGDINVEVRNAAGEFDDIREVETREVSGESQSIILRVFIFT